MWVHAHAVNYLGDAKTPMQNTQGEGAEPGQKEGKMMPDVGFLQDCAKNAGCTFSSSDLKGGKDFHSQTGESMIHLAQRYAQAAGGVSYWSGGDNVQIFLKQTVRGFVTARWSDYLIACRVRPMAARGAWGGGSQQHYDSQAGNWMQTAKQFGLGQPWGQAEGTFSPAAPAPNAGDAGSDNSGNSERASMEPGFGRIIINGEPAARFWGQVELIGVRPGVDGVYRIWSAEHVYDRRQGYVTWLEVQIEASAAGSANVGSIGWLTPEQQAQIPRTAP